MSEILTYAVPALTGLAIGLLVGYLTTLLMTRT